MDDKFFYIDIRRPFSKEVVSLQTMIIKVVTVNFARYMHEYKSPDSGIPKYFFEFLQKKYSQELLFYLMDYGLLKLEFIDFVFNIHLKEVSLKSGLKQKKLESIKQKIMIIGDSLTSVSLLGEANFHHLRPILSFIPCVKKLELEYSNCDDSTLKVIADNCPLLTELSLYATLVSDQGMKHLCFPEKHKLHLESLTVSRTHVKDTGVLMILKNIPSLQILAHENLSRIVSSAVAKHEFPANQILNLTFVEIHNAETELETISHLCPNVRHLFVKSINSPLQLLNCCQFKNLKEVCITGRRPSLCIDEFLKISGSHISNLSLENFIVSASVLLQSCPNLQVLKLYDPSFSELAGWRTLRMKFHKLTHFKIYGCSLLSEKEVQSPALILECSPSLESFSLQCCFIGSHMENVILNCSATLIQLDFTESLVSVDFLQEIVFKHKMLQCLIIENSGLHSNDYHSLFDLIEHLNHPVNMVWC